ncbi:MAG TPA: PEP-CTERM sorting domain-containing protein [Gemmatimonadaceae bacterium]|nr:PEP-CTERM sorting domain-containing protein [Gemmatimonadaceae bacterium]
MKMHHAVLAAAFVAAAASPARADTCGGNNFVTCASVGVGSTWNAGTSTWAITMTVINPVGNNSSFKAIGLHNLPAGVGASAFVMPSNWTTPANELNGDPIEDKVVGIKGKTGNDLVAPGGSIVFSFNLTGLNADYVFDDWAIHATRGPNGCSTKLVVTNGQANQGPFNPECGDPVSVTPEPASVVLMASGLLVLVGGGAMRRRRRSAIEA